MYELITFLCGMGVMILELAGVRIITPFLGGTHIVYTSVIGIIMASLSSGYYLGGKLSKKNASISKLSLIIFLAAIYIFSLSFVQFWWLRKIMYFHLPLISKTLICSFGMFVVPSVLMGIVTPYILQVVLNELKQKNISFKEGETAGKFYAVSTIGSIIGTFLCGFYLIIHFGIDRIFLFLSFMLFVCAFLCLAIQLKKNVKIAVFYAFLIFVSAFFLFYFNYKPLTVFKDTIYAKTTQYNYINIIEKQWGNDTVRMLKNNFSSIYKNSSSERYPYKYIEMFHYIFENKIKKNEILILGNAVGTSIKGLLAYCDRMNLHNINFDIVEIDKEFTKIGEDYFGLPKNDKRMKYFYEDARTFLNRSTTKKYDIIFFDIYAQDHSHLFPHHLITKEAIEEIYKKLEYNGIFVMNVVGSKSPQSILNDYVRQIYTQISFIFPEVKLYPATSNGSSEGNHIIIGYKNPDTDDNKNIRELLKDAEISVNKTDVIFTDKFSPIEKFI